MKYQVSVEYTWEGEFSVEAGTKEEAIEMVNDITFSDPWEESTGSHTMEVLEVYEWDEKAQERMRKNVKLTLEGKTYYAFRQLDAPAGQCYFISGEDKWLIDKPFPKDHYFWELPYYSDEVQKFCSELEKKLKEN